ncbi:hypothetical protein ACSBR1_005485 [Camellia fascicularis]
MKKTISHCGNKLVQSMLQQYPKLYHDKFWGSRLFSKFQLLSSSWCWSNMVDHPMEDLITSHYFAGVGDEKKPTHLYVQLRSKSSADRHGNARTQTMH